MMSKWETVKIEDIAEVRSGKRLPKGETLVSDVTPYPYIRLVDVADGRIQKGSLQYLKEETRESIKRYIVNTNDVCLAIVGHTIGMVFFVEEEWDNVNLTENAARITNVDESLNPRFLYYYLTSSVGQNEIVSRKVGSAQGKLPLYNIRSLEVPRPPRSIQDFVVLILDSLSFKVQLNGQTNQTLEQIAQAIFKSWFVDFDPVKAKIAAKQNGQDPELAAICAISGKTEAQLKTLDTATLQQLKTTAALFPDALVESELGEVPEGWEVKKLKEVCRVINGRAYKNTEFKEEGTPIVRIQNLSKRGKTVFSDLELPEDKMIDKEDFIYAWSATFGPHIWRGPKSIYHYHIWKMDVNEEVISRYFLYLSMFRKTEQMKSAGTGSIFTHLTKAIMESQDILIGSPELNELFKNLLDSYFKKITALEIEVESLENLREALLPKLLSGEITLNNAPPKEEIEA